MKTGGEVWDVVVVGAGPAGLLAAGRAAMLGARVLLLEKMEKPARKLRISGKGRGNLTNLKPMEAHFAEIQPEPRFLRDAFQAFFNQDLIALVEAQGVPTRVERGGRVFPASGQAWDAAEALVAWARSQGVVLRTQAEVRGLVLQEGAFAGVTLRARPSGRPEQLLARCGIVATGGCSYPATGSTGDGHRFAAASGHRIETPQPSLVRLDTRPVYPGAQGLTLKHVQVTLWLDGRKEAAEFGEAEFTARGLAGAAVLRLSRRIVAALAAGRTAAVSLDLKPALEAPRLAERLAREQAARPGATCSQLLRAFLPAPLVGLFCEALGLRPAAPATRLDGPRSARLIALLKDLRLDVVGHGGWEEAIVTAGGIALHDLDPRTLASRQVARLYFAGEVLDLDAHTGGYNLQIAFSTGWLAGQSAAREAEGAW